jgi:hypothetical protein
MPVNISVKYNLPLPIAEQVTGSIVADPRSALAISLWWILYLYIAKKNRWIKIGVINYGTCWTDQLFLSLVGQLFANNTFYNLLYVSILFSTMTVKILLNKLSKAQQEYYTFLAKAITPWKSSNDYVFILSRWINLFRFF